ncbi:c-type cytochrome [Bacillus sp. RAR_GA_16]|uniref:c-type cytochrome n=1 Tax=Bacillus sp. RAR_GA_16 TaxID=2876774 RepID=UPI001CC98D7B|nr:cytochrome c [Bacillus sp. RAR_GA_16]MCA0172776.1 cytochrome c [Bacillus sp. RAR_GA_16]
MKKWLGILVAVVLLFSLAACGGGNNSENNNGGSSNSTSNDSAGESSGDYDAKAAEATYQTNCLSCHGDNLQGKVGPQISDVGSRLSKDEILTVIQNGKGQMPGNILGGDTEKEENLASWLADMK